MNFTPRALWKRSPWLAVTVSLLVLTAASWGAVRLSRPTLTVPTSEVKLGEFVDYVRLRGEINALKSVTVTAPFSAGDLQIIKLARNGSLVKKGEPVVQFDAVKLRQTLDQDRSDLNRTKSEIEQAGAQARMKEEQDQTDLMKARYDLEAAKLDASKAEIVSKIEGEEAKLKVEDAEQKLREAEGKLKSDRSANAAQIEAKKQKRDKALFDLRQTERNLAVMTLKAPIDGMVTLLPNWRASGPFGGRVEFKEGDRAWPGAAIADLPDLSTLRAEARVDETDRARLKLGQTTTVRVDALPDQEFAGRVARISTLATTDFSASWPFPRNFDLEVELDRADARLRPGMTASPRVVVDRLPNSIVIPTQAAFQKFGQTVAYVLHGAKFEMRPIEVGRRGEGQLLITGGLKLGEFVALRDPTEKQ